MQLILNVVAAGEKGNILFQEFFILYVSPSNGYCLGHRIAMIDMVYLRYAILLVDKIKSVTLCDVAMHTYPKKDIWYAKP